MNGSFLSGGLQLARYLVKPSGKTGALPAMVLCHGYPSGGIDARHSAGTFPELAERVANELGWNAMTFTFRGCATSEGDFSMHGWVDDLRAAMVITPADRLVCVLPPMTRVLMAAHCLGRVQTSTTGQNSRVGSLNTLAKLERFVVRGSRLRQKSGVVS